MFIYFLFVCCADAFYPAVGRQKLWWKVRVRHDLENVVQWLGSLSQRCKTVRSPTIAPQYSGLKTSNIVARAAAGPVSAVANSAQVRLRSPTIRLTRPSTPPSSAIRGGVCPAVVFSSSSSFFFFFFFFSRQLSLSLSLSLVRMCHTY